MADNTSDMETGNQGPMTQSEATEHLAGLLANSEAASAEPEGETEEVEVEAEAEADMELEAEDSEDDESAEYEAAEEATDEIEEPADYVEIDGHRVNLDEVGNGYLRQADYTKKTQELAQQRKANESELASIAAEREHLKQMLEFAGNQQHADAPSAELANDDPLEYIRQKAIFDASQADTQAAQAEQYRLSQIENTQRQQQMQAFVADQAAMMAEAVPELTGENAANYRANIVTYMEGVGYSKDELTQLYDHRAVVLADKARKYDALMSKKTTTEKKVRGKPKVVRPGVAVSKKAQSSEGRKKAVARARKSGSVDDAVAALLA